MAGRERKNELSQLSAPEKEQRHVKKIKKRLFRPCSLSYTRQHRGYSRAIQDSASVDSALSGTALGRPMSMTMMSHLGLLFTYIYKNLSA